MTDAERAGTLARSAFELLAAGTPAAELVVRLGIEPQRAKDLVLAYQELRELGVSSRAAAFVACCRCGSNAARVCSECSSGHENAAHAG